MWKWFKGCLDKIVQGVKNIFRKKNKTQEWDSITFSTGAGSCDEIHLGPGQITIMPLDDINEAEITWEKPKTFSDLSDEEYEELKKLFNIPRTNLPKPIHVPTLLVSCYANWSYDSIGVDLSQLDEKGIAHYWCTSTKSMEEHGAEPGDEDPITTMIEDAVLIEIDGCWFWDA